MGSRYDRTQLIKKAQYLADKLNTKSRTFKKEGFGDRLETRIHRAMVTLSQEYDLFNESGTLKKGKKNFEQLSDRDLNRYNKLLESIHKSDNIGTVKKYKDYVATKNKATIDTFKSRMGDKAWKSLCEALGGEQQATDHLLRILEKERAKRGNTFNSEQLILNETKEIIGDDEVLNATLNETNKVLKMLEGKKMISNSPWRK